MSPPPLWTALLQTLEADIAAGRYPPGARLPSEADLAARFGVNRHTVRRALAALAEAGIVHARRGAGVFVLGRLTDYPLGRRTRLTQNLAAAGQRAERNTLRLETLPADPAEAEALRLRPAAPVHVWEGVSMADGTPLSLFRASFDAARFPDLPQALRRLNSVTAALAEAGVTDYTRASTRLTAVTADPVRARHLLLPPGAPLLRTVAINVDAAGRPLEYGRTWFAGDRVQIVVENP
jgi:GntR family transcriptional regulator, phosphonate transport system regulatory protein